MMMKELIKRLEDIGAARERLRCILDTIEFPNPSKHNDYYESKDEEASEKLDELRRKISYFCEEMFEVLAMLTYEDGDDE